MKQIHLIMLFCLILLSAKSSAQEGAKTPFTVKGVLVDSLTKQGEPYATLKIAQKTTPETAIKASVTTTDGKFNIKLGKADTYILTLSSIGRKTITKEFSVSESKKTVDLGTLLISDATNELKGVEIVAQRPLVKVDADKVTYNMKDDPESKTNTLLEMLKKVPKVTVDGEDNIKVNGSSSFKVLVNGKPNNMMTKNPKEIFKSFPANTVKSIEVLTNPGVKYDAEGVGGVLNIITESKGMEGYLLSVNAGLDSKGGYNGSTYATVQKGKLTVSVNYNYSKNKNPESYSNSSLENFASTTERSLLRNSVNKGDGSFNYGDLEASYEIDSLRLISVAATVMGGPYNNNGYGNTIMLGSDGITPSYSYFNNNHNKSTWSSYHASMDYQRSFKNKPDRLLTFSYNLDSGPQTGDSYLNYDSLLGNWEKLKLINSHYNNKENTMENTFQVDYTTPFKKIHTFDMGMKYIIRNNHSENWVYQNDASQAINNEYTYVEDKSSKYRHLSNILAAYFGYTLRTKKLMVKPGLRYEYTSQKVNYYVGKGADFNTHFGDLVPALSVGWNLTEMQNLQFNYSMRIYRPGISMLNPYFNNENPMNITQGNSDLKSEKYHRFSLGYSNYGMKIGGSISITHSFSNDCFEDITRIVGANETIDGHPVLEGALYERPYNTGKQNSTGLDLSGNINPTPTTRIYINASGDYSDFSSKQQPLHNYGWSGNFYANIQQTIWGGVKILIYGGGGTPSYSLQGKSTGWSFYGISLRKSFLEDDRLTLSMHAGNFFKKYRTYTDTTSGPNFISSSVSKFDSSRIGFSVSLRFGKLQASVKKAERSIVNDDVKGGGGGQQGGQQGGGGGGQ